MRTMLVIAVLPLAAVASAQESGQKSTKGATGYAGELAKIAGQYLTEVEKKINAEEEAYADAARLYASAHERATYRLLEAERDTEAADLALALIEGRAGVSELISTSLPDYAADDFARTRALFSQELEGYRSFLASLIDLQAETRKIASLRQALGDLSKKPDLEEWLASLQTFGAKFGRQLRFSDCSLSSARLAFFQSEAKRIDQLLATAEPADKPRLAAEKASVEARQKELAARRTATGVYDEKAKACKAE
jgi:hypothetical protein